MTTRVRVMATTVRRIPTGDPARLEDRATEAHRGTAPSGVNSSGCSRWRRPTTVGHSLRGPFSAKRRVGGKPVGVDTQDMVEEHQEQAAYFEKWYADMTGESVKDEIEQRHLGLPPNLLSTSLLTWDGVAEVAAALNLARGELLVDLACGRGGYGLELAARGQARVLGIDFAPSALETARAKPAAISTSHLG